MALLLVFLMCLRKVRVLFRVISYVQPSSMSERVSLGSEKCFFEGVQDGLTLVHCDPEGISRLLYSTCFQEAFGKSVQVLEAETSRNRCASNNSTKCWVFLFVSSPIADFPGSVFITTDRRVTSLRRAARGGGTSPRLRVQRSQ